ncbi:MAG: UDP-glucose/GDP-mannose dehydrogenase family protein [Candidatus Cloacimonetes bacterium]|nr:UDP-glucose/GDP-mannose dehydrogenase family protein [Candidatus Cloacimonadota bacterium]
MKLAVIGTGYVGLVTGTCFAEMGNTVVCVDNDEGKIEKLLAGVIPIYEPGLDKLVKRNTAEERLLFTTDTCDAVQRSLICFIAVGTPPDEDGSADLQYVLAVADEIATHMDGYKVIVNKSTVPVGTADLVRQTVQSRLDERGVNYEFDIVSNPEFLKEGAAIDDFMKPDRIVVGTDNVRVGEIMRELYAPFSRIHEKCIIMSVRSAEMTKYAANCMLATKISFMNEIAGLCERLGADVAEVRHGIGSDSRIGYKFIFPGVGYGGSCFPKDVKALINMGRRSDTSVALLDAVEDVNERQKHLMVHKIKKHFGDNLAGKTIAVWGLSFKPDTDDMREAPSLVIVPELLKVGARIQVFDPVAMDEARRILGDHPNLIYTKGNFDALEGANALALITEWRQFRYPDFERIKAALTEPVVFDGRNQYNPTELEKLGFTYYGVGRGKV